MCQTKDKNISCSPLGRRLKESDDSDARGGDTGRRRSRDEEERQFLKLRCEKLKTEISRDEKIRFKRLILHPQSVWWKIKIYAGEKLNLHFFFFLLQLNVVTFPNTKSEYEWWAFPPPPPLSCRFSSLNSTKSAMQVYQFFSSDISLDQCLFQKSPWGTFLLLVCETKKLRFCLRTTAKKSKATKHWCEYRVCCNEWKFG